MPSALSGGRRLRYDAPSSFDSPSRQYRSVWMPGVNKVKKVGPAGAHCVNCI